MRLDMQDVLVRAGHLAKHGRGRIRVSHSEQKVSYYHILLERHETLFANGVMAESLYPQSLSFEFARPAELAQTQTEPNTVLPVLSSAAVRHAFIGR